MKKAKIFKIEMAALNDVLDNLKSKLDRVFSLFLYLRGDTPSFDYDYYTSLLTVYSNIITNFMNEINNLLLQNNSKITVEEEVILKFNKYKQAMIICESEFDACPFLSFSTN